MTYKYIILVHISTFIIWLLGLHNTLLSGCNTDERTHTEIRPSRYLVRMAETTDLETAEAQERPKEQIVDPWQAVAAEGETSIDYDKLIGMIQCAVHDSINT